MLLCAAGVVLPKLAIFWLIDVLSVRQCQDAKGQTMLQACPGSIDAAKAANACTLAGGTCTRVRDGFYTLSFIAVASGLGLFFWFRRALPRLEALPKDAWRAKARHHKY